MPTNGWNNITLQRNGKTALYRQLAEKLAVLIENGSFKPNDRLPPIRALAEALDVNNITVVNAYRYLQNKRMVYSVTGSGVYVSDISVRDALMPEFSYNFIGKTAATDGMVNLAKSSASPDLFPVKEFQMFLNEALDRDKGLAFGYQDIAGYEPLREAISRHVLRYGIRANMDRIQIINGAQQGIDLISKALLSHGDALFVEKPTYYGAVGAFFSRGAQIVDIKLEKDGMDFDALETYLKIYKPKFIYVMPYFQTPSGVTYSLEKKRRLLELADKYNTYIIEEDNQNDFAYGDFKIVPIKALDYKNRVIYIKSFSKIMMPGLRLGFMILPKAIQAKVMDIKYATDISSAGLTQRAFDLFLRSSVWDERLSYMKGIFKSRYGTLAACLNDRRLRSALRCDLPGGGCSVWVRLIDADTEKLCETLLKQGVLVTPGSIYSLTGEKLPYIRISFAAANESEITRGIQVLAELLY